MTTNRTKEDALVVEAGNLLDRAHDFLCELAQDKRHEWNSAPVSEAVEDPAALIHSLRTLADQAVARLDSFHSRSE